MLAIIGGSGLTKLGNMEIVRRKVAVLADKRIGKPKPVAPDFVGLDLPNRFVFGCGLDAHGSWRNLPAIYAVKGT